MAKYAAFVVLCDMCEITFCAGSLTVLYVKEEKPLVVKGHHKRLHPKKEVASPVFAIAILLILAMRHPRKKVMVKTMKTFLSVIVLLTGIMLGGAASFAGKPKAAKPAAVLKKNCEIQASGLRPQGCKIAGCRLHGGRGALCA